MGGLRLDGEALLGDLSDIGRIFADPFADLLLPDREPGINGVSDLLEETLTSERRFQQVHPFRPDATGRALASINAD